MTAYALHCSVCDQISEGRRAWLEHLLESKHQNFAKQEVSGWNKALRKCAVVVFASFPVACYDVLEYFSKEMDIVTDFVAIPSKSNSGILQFESREKVVEILSKFECQEIRIGKQLMQLKKASKYLELEWKQLIQEFEQNNLPREGENDYANDALHDTNSEISSVQSRFPVLKSQSKLTETQSSAAKVNIESAGSLLQNENQMIQSDELLMKQFDDIRTQIEIPDDDYNQALELMSKMASIFSQSYPKTKLYMFRHGYVKLQAQELDPLLIFLDYQGELEGGEVNLDEKLLTDDVKWILAQASPLEIVVSEEGKSQPREREPLGMPYVYLNANLHFKLASHPWFKLEVQSCRLLKYLSSFDDRVIPLLMLVHHWAKVNNIKLHNTKFISSELDVIPEPAALDWLVMLALCKQGIIPSPRKIVYQKKVRRVSMGKNGADIGFSENTSEINNWRNRMCPAGSNASDIISILELAVIFFSTYSAKGDHVWNTRDGEILKTNVFFKEYLDMKKITKMTNYEIGIVQNRTKKSICRSILLHPLDYRLKFAFTPMIFVNNILPMMKVTAGKLTEFLSSYRNSQGKASLSLESVFVVDIVK